FAQGEALDSLDRLARQVLPPGSTTALAGDSREFKESGGALYFAFGVALLVVFMVLASQFESLVHPFTVLLAVPLAVTGALATLLLAALLHRPGGTINLYSEIGMVLLIGLVTKNSILLVEYANQLKDRCMVSLGRLRVPLALWPVCGQGARGVRGRLGGAVPAPAHARVRGGEPVGGGRLRAPRGRGVRGAGLSRPPPAVPRGRGSARAPTVT